MTNAATTISGKVKNFLRGIRRRRGGGGGREKSDPSPGEDKKKREEGMSKETGIPGSRSGLRLDRAIE